MLFTKPRMSFWPSISLLQVFFALQFITACLAQIRSSENVVAMASTTSKSASSSVSSAPLQTHTIQVGLADHKFVPNVTQAAVGDTLEFRFYPLNHSVARAEYLMPCIPYEMSGPGKTGFFTGFHPVSAVLDDPPSYSVRVNDTNPIFFYCSAPGSCINYGMVGAVNPGKDQDLEQHHQKAKDSTYMLNPGEPFPAEGEPEAGHGGINGTGAGDGGGTVSDTKGGSKPGLSSGAIAGIVVGGIAVIVLAALLFFFWGRTKSLEDEVDRKAGTIRRVSSSSQSGTSRKENAQKPHSAGVNASMNNGVSTPRYQHYQHNSTSPMSDMIQQHQHHQQQHQQQHQHQIQQMQQSGYSNPAPSYYTPPALPHKLDISSPTGHPAYPGFAPSSSPPPTHSAHHHHNSIRSEPHASPATTYELSHSPIYPYNNPSVSSTSASPICHTVSPPLTHNNGIIGVASATAAAVSTTTPANTTDIKTPYNPPAPSYFETVHRPGPFHLNGRLGPAEMEAADFNSGGVAGGDVGSAVAGEQGHVEGDREAVG
ncbi:hypothetical protein J1614_008050, partial [Plenodomus biglobosus]